MKMRFLAAALLSSLCTYGVVNAQQPDTAGLFDVVEQNTTESVAPAAAPSDNEVRLSGRSSSDVSTSKPTVMELRQARAMYRSQQRIARMERNLWMGYEPLRPGWTSIPFLQSRYPIQRTIYTPVYYYAR